MLINRSAIERANQAASCSTHRGLKPSGSRANPARIDHHTRRKAWESDPTATSMLNRTSKRSKSGEGASDRGARVRYRGPDTAAAAVAVRTLEKGEKERPYGARPVGSPPEDGGLGGLWAPASSPSPPSLRLEAAATGTKEAARRRRRRAAEGKGGARAREVVAIATDSIGGGEQISPFFFPLSGPWQLEIGRAHV